MEVFIGGKEGITPPVIFMHGFMKDSTTWNMTESGKAIDIEHQIGQTTQVVNITFDSQSYDMGFDETAKKISQMLIENRIEPPWILVGHSIGGMYAMTLASLFPEHVFGMVLVDSSVPMPSFEDEIIRSIKDETDQMKKQIFETWERKIGTMPDIDRIDSDTIILSHINVLKNEKRIQNTVSKFYDNDQSLYDNEQAEILQFNKNIVSRNGRSKLFTHVNSTHMIHHKEPGRIIASIKKLLNICTV